MYKVEPQLSQELSVVERLSSHNHFPNIQILTLLFTLDVVNVVTKCPKYCKISLRYVSARIEYDSNAIIHNPLYLVELVKNICFTVTDS